MSHLIIHDGLSNYDQFVTAVQALLAVLSSWF